MKNFTLKNITKTTAKNSNLDSFASNVSKKKSFSLNHNPNHSKINTSNSK